VSTGELIEMLRHNPLGPVSNINLTPLIHTSVGINYTSMNANNHLTNITSKNNAVLRKFILLLPDFYYFFHYFFSNKEVQTTAFYYLY